jgi:hypothetical protein
MALKNKLLLRCISTNHSIMVGVDDENSTAARRCRSDEGGMNGVLYVLIHLTMTRSGCWVWFGGGLLSPFLYML